MACFDPNVVQSMEFSLSGSNFVWRGVFSPSEQNVA